MSVWRIASHWFSSGEQLLYFLPRQRFGELLLATQGGLDDFAFAGLQSQDFFFDRILGDEFMNKKGS